MSSIILTDLKILSDLHIGSDTSYMYRLTAGLSV